MIAFRFVPIEKRKSSTFYQMLQRVFTSGTHSGAPDQKNTWSDSEVEAVFNATGADVPVRLGHNESIIGFVPRTALQLLTESGRKVIAFVKDKASLAAEALDAARRAGYKYVSAEVAIGGGLVGIALVQSPAVAANRTQEFQHAIQVQRVPALFEFYANANANHSSMTTEQTSSTAASVVPTAPAATVQPVPATPATHPATQPAPVPATQAGAQEAQPAVSPDAALQADVKALVTELHAERERAVAAADKAEFAKFAQDHPTRITPAHYAKYEAMYLTAKRYSTPMKFAAADGKPVETNLLAEFKALIAGLPEAFGTEEIATKTAAGHSKFAEMSYSQKVKLAQAKPEEFELMVATQVASK